MKEGYESSEVIDIIQESSIDDDSDKEEIPDENDLENQIQKEKENIKR